MGNFSYTDLKLVELEKNDIIKNLIDFDIESRIVKLNELLSQKQKYKITIKNDLSSYVLVDGKKTYTNEALEIINKLNDDINILKSYLKYLKIKFSSLSKSEILLNEDDNIVLSDKNKIILSSLLDENRDISNIKIENLSMITKYLIMNSNILETKSIIYDIILNFVKRLDDDPKILLELNSIKSVLKLKKMKLDKSFKEQKRVINNLRSVIKNYIEIYNRKRVFSYNYLYDIIDIWLDSEENYKYLIKLFDRIPISINLKNKNQEHLIISVLKRYIYSYKAKLINQSSNIVDVDYYKKIYKFLINKISLNENDINLMINLIDEYKQFLNDSSYRRDRVVEALSDLSQLIENDVPITKNYDENYILNELKYINDIIKKENETKRIDKTNEYTITFSNNNYKGCAYSLKKENDLYVLGIHIIDMVSVIYPETIIDKMIKSKGFSDVKNNDYLLPEKIMEELSLKVGKTMPTITFEIGVKNLEVVKFSVYKSKIFVDKDVTKSEFSLMADYNKFSSILTGSNTNFDESLIQYEISKQLDGYMNSLKLTPIYKNYESQNHLDISKSISLINDKLFKLKREDADIIYSILMEGNSCSYYSLFNNSKNYIIPFINPLDNYISYFNLRILCDRNFIVSDILDDEKNIEIKKRKVKKNV